MISPLRPLRHRNFALVWASALVSNVGSWMQTVALGVVITARTHDPLWTGAVAAAAFVPIGALAPVGGALADRLDRRRWLITTTLAEAAFATLLAVLSATGHAPPWALVVVAFFGGVSAAIGFPSYQAMLPDLVPRDELLGAVTLSSAQFNLGRVVGPALAGLVLVAGSATWAFAVNAISFGAVVGALAFVRLPARHVDTSDVGIVRRMVDGARVAASDPGCRNAIVLIAIVALVGSPFIALVPAVAIDALHRGAGGTSVLVTAQGIGAVVGALALGPLAGLMTRRWLLVGSLLTFPLALVVYGVAPSLWGKAAALVAVGGCYIGVLSGLNTVVQLRAPAAARGRVLGLYMMALGLIYPIGAVVEGALARVAGIDEVTVAAGAVLLGVMLVLHAWRSNLFEAFEDPAAVVQAEAESEAEAEGDGRLSAPVVAAPGPAVDTARATP
ncbi:MAG TPA: MFS transporter [Acidimicrobiales bacterium]|nr:MFS transporter [Acidimicrobiales bacterium]